MRFRNDRSSWLVSAGVIGLWAVVVMFMASSFFTPAQATAPGALQPPPLTSGADLYQASCASCHGADGKGTGAGLGALESRPADLTRLAAENDGEFPDERIQQLLDSKLGTAPHGTPEAPVWGPVFSGSCDENLNRLRVRHLTRYIEAMQGR